MTTTPETTAALERRYPGRHYLLLGIGLALLGVVAFVLQMATQRLFLPLYLPISATLGTLLIIASVWQARTVWRFIALALVILVAGAEWGMLAMLRLPDYTGPVAAEKPFPEFTTARADGTSFTQRDLQGEQDNVVVFFRGRW